MFDFLGNFFFFHFVLVCEYSEQHGMISRRIVSMFSSNYSSGVLGEAFSFIDIFSCFADT